jgi:hypothetical protein
MREMIHLGWVRQVTDMAMLSKPFSVFPVGLEELFEPFHSIFNDDDSRHASLSDVERLNQGQK